MVERHLAKVNVASTNLGFRSKIKIQSQDRIFILYYLLNFVGTGYTCSPFFIVLIDKEVHIV